MPLLSPGDAFPRLSLSVPGGQAVQVPEAFAGHYGVPLFNRGAWCPYCNAQLRAFQRASATLADAGTRVASLSVDDEATTAELIARHGLTFPVGFGADAARSWSASTPAAPSAGWSPRTSPGWSATTGSRPRRPLIPMINKGDRGDS